ncbi:MAG TPA: acyl-CoA dehydrogenase, partial [Woeseiaceae bacterium]|nr:acyl-CoA dehydrogenase [Woeseiaceae bacterium]
MALVLNEEQQMLRDSVKSFIQESSPVGALRKLRDSGEEWSPELWSGMAEMGWTGIAIPEDFGGLEFGYVGAGLVLEECGRTLAASPLLSSSFVCASLLEAAGSEAQKESLLAALAGGETVVTLALCESNRFDPTNIATTATADGDTYVLNGSKKHVLDGAIANTFIVVARLAGDADSEGGPGLFLVDRDAEGLSVSTTLNADNRRVASLGFESVRVAADAVIGEPGANGAVLARALDIGAALSAAELLGVAQESFERTLDYLKERKQFGVPVASFQALQHRAAQLFCELELCKSCVLKALQAIDEDSPERSRLASMAKAKVAKTSK